MTNAIAWYDAHAEDVAAQYEDVSSEAVHGWLTDLLPASSAAVLDIGAGSGRDAAWLADKGYEVVAAEPSSKMRALAARKHPDSRIQWSNDALPALPDLTRSGLSFDLILASAVWMHVPPGKRLRAFRKMINLLRPGGLIAITLRQGYVDPQRGMHPVTVGEIEDLARSHGAFVERCVESTDRLGRNDVSWTQIAVRLPDDGLGALPLLRHIILNDDKSSTYKPALLRSLCRVADGASGFVVDRDDDTVAVPLGLVALTWVRLFKPLISAGLPQSPTNVGSDGHKLGFVKEGFKQLKEVSHLDMRVGMSFSGDAGKALHAALKDAAETIARMPATYIKYPDGKPIFPIDRAGRVQRPARVLLNKEYLASFGKMIVPRHLWRALRRFDVWIEPALVAEWGRLMKGYAERQERQITDGDIALAMDWSEPSRDVRIARERAVRLSAEEKLFCVWSGRRLSMTAADIDHCFPWSAWSCGDLWNLMPAHRNVNQREKRARLPGNAILKVAQDRILSWWDHAYQDDRALEKRFWLEATASLPTVISDGDELSDIFDALCLQRMRLKRDQQVPEWEGENHLIS